VGEFKVPVKLHREVTVNINAIVKKDAVEEEGAGPSDGKSEE
jgi:hypothetical protein